MACESETETQRRREIERERERERERKLILGARDALKTQRFRLGFLPFFSLSSPCHVRVRHGHGRQIYVSVLSCLWLTVLLPLK